MESRAQEPKDRQMIDRILGYLNFSSGAPDPQFLGGLNELFARVAEQESPWQAAVAALESELPHLQQGSATFADISQARAVLRLLSELLPAYREFHADLLFHQSEATLFRPFFVGRACEAILLQGAPWDDTARIVSGALRRLNDFIGYRPVVTLETQRHEPYPHEWVRPIPIYIEGVGVELGANHEIVARAVEILQATDPAILRAAYFDPALMQELAIDPRAYDFDHPVNKRPNHHFGQWDPHCIDNQGRYRRFVIRQVTLQALTARLDEESALPREELLFEAAAVLAGTVLMASGISGSGPDTHDSTVTLSNLLPIIASYRDAFYEQLMDQCKPDHKQRLLAEAASRHQPFGGARQHLNAWLSRRRASQLEHVQLAKIFARMGYPDAAMRQASVVPATSARMLCEIDCQLAAGFRAVETGALTRATQVTRKVRDQIDRAIQCGAIIDPWSILGFDAHFSLFPALENSVHDHRADELVELMDRFFGLYSRIWRTAAAEDERKLCVQIRERFQDATSWWRQFAVHEVSSVDAVDPQEVFQAAEHVAESLNLWHKGGAETGDVRFWAPHAHMFDSPRAFSLVIEALLERRDYVASMALLIRWLNQADHVPLERADSSFHQLTEQWLLSLINDAELAGANNELPSRGDLVRKFFDFLEANAEEYWDVPRFELGRAPTGDQRPGMPLEIEQEDEDEEEHLYSAAYDGMVYCDSTDDGVDGELYETGDATTDELTAESQRISDRVVFLRLLARLWKLAAVGQRRLCQSQGSDDKQDTSHGCAATMRHWIHHAVSSHRQLIELLQRVRNYRIRTMGTDPETLQQYDRQRLVKDALLERIATSCVDISATGQTMLASLAAHAEVTDAELDELAGEFGEEAPVMVRVMAALLRGDNEQVAELWPILRDALADKTLLYVPLSREGNSRQIVAARCRQCQLQDLLAWLPRRGLWKETCELIETARRMERNNPVGPGAVTEFDELFKVGYRALVESLVNSAQSWEPTEENESPENAVAAALEELTEVLLASWLNHSRTLRLSVLERVQDERRWEELVKFIKRYGGELFTQRFFHLGNLRAILHQGVGDWLCRLEEEGDIQLRLLDELDGKISREDAEEHLSVILEAVVENYGEYRDYNSTTTQSDRGDMLYTLLDFLRLRTQYDRVCWHLKPVIWAHEILVTRQQGKAARLWRRALTERIAEEANNYLDRLEALQQNYSIRMSTVADRLAERFVRPMVIDRMRALVWPALEEAARPGTKPTFELLEHQTESLARESTGIGFDMPVWLLALEEEVDRARQPDHHHDFEQQVAGAIEYVQLSHQQVREALGACVED